MNAKKIWADFNVKDAKRTNQFYSQLGFTPNKSNNDTRLASFLFGDDFVIHIVHEAGRDETNHYGFVFVDLMVINYGTIDGRRDLINLVYSNYLNEGYLCQYSNDQKNTY